MAKTDDELVETYRQNHKRLFERVLSLQAPLGPQLLFAGQQAEREAYEEVFGEAFRQIYDSFITKISLGGSIEIIEKSREQVRGTEVANLVEEFKATFKSVLEQLKTCPLKQLMTITTQLQIVEEEIVNQLLPKVETRYKVKTLPFEKGEAGHEVTIPPDHMVVSVNAGIICLERLARTIKKQEEDRA